MFEREKHSKCCSLSYSWPKCLILGAGSSSPMLFCDFSGFLTAGSSLYYFHEQYQVQPQGSTLLRLLLQGSTVTVTSCKLSWLAIVFTLSWHFLSSFLSVALFLWFQVFSSFLGSSFPFPLTHPKLTTLFSSFPQICPSPSLHHCHSHLSSNQHPGS